MSEVRKILKINLVLVALCAASLILAQAYNQAFSFLMGVLFSMINFLILVYISKKIIEGKSVFIPLILTLNKYLLLFLGVYFIVRTKSISLPWVIFGLMILIPTVVVYGFLLVKKQGYFKKL